MLGKLSVPGRPTYLDCSRARAYCTCSRCGWGLFGHFYSRYHFSFLSPPLQEAAQYRLKYCLKGPLSPKQPTNLFCRASSGSEPSLFFSNYFFSLGLQPIQDDFQHDFARMTDETDSSVVLAELQDALFRECNNQRLSPWVRPFSCSSDSVTDLC